MGLSLLVASLMDLIQGVPLTLKRNLNVLAQQCQTGWNYQLLNQCVCNEHKFNAACVTSVLSSTL